MLAFWCMTVEQIMNLVILYIGELFLRVALCVCNQL